MEPLLPLNITHARHRYKGAEPLIVETCAELIVGVVNVGLVDKTLLPLPVDVVTPVPPFATASVPASVIVPDVVIGPPDVVNPVVPPDTATDVTVPVPPAVAAMLIPPAEFVIVMLDPAVNVVRVNPVPLPMSIAPLAGAVVRPVPPLATATVPVTLAAVPVVF